MSWGDGGNSAATRFGDPNRFAVEVGEFWRGDPQFRRVDLWAADRWLTCDDNIAFVPQFCGSVRGTLSWLRSWCDLSLPYAGLSAAETHSRLLSVDDGSREQFWFPLWGPTTDNQTGHIFRVGDRLVLTFEFWRESHPVPEERGAVFVVELPEAEFVGILKEMLALLESGD